MTEQPDNTQSLHELLVMLENAYAPFDDHVVEMDCTDDCEEIAELAERVASGENLNVIFPEYAQHLAQVRCSKEEFDALVSVIRAEIEADQNS